MISEHDNMSDSTDNNTYSCFDVYIQASDKQRTITHMLNLANYELAQAHRAALDGLADVTGRPAQILSIMHHVRCPKSPVRACVFDTIDDPDMNSCLFCEQSSSTSRFLRDLSHE